MRILLVIPSFHYGTSPAPLLSLSDFPSGFAYIAAALKQAGHEVIGLNPNNDLQKSEPYYFLCNQLAKVIEKTKPELIALGGICTDFPFLKDAIELSRKFAPGVPIVLGGGIISHDREFVFHLLHPDFGIVGEGEDAIVALVQALQEQKGFGHIDNLSYWRGGEAVFNQVNHAYRPVDEYPFPDYSIFGAQKMIDDFSMATRLLYRYSRAEPRPFPIVTARGCPFNCTFCIHRGNQFYRPRSIENVMEEIRVNYQRYKFNILIILDELFAINKKRMKEFCEAVMEGKRRYGWDFDWMFQAHASAALNYDSLVLAKQAGCVFFSYGIESASPRVLESMNKRTKVPQIIEAIRLADSVGIGFGGNLIFGDPAETQETIYESLAFFAKYCQAAFVFLGFLMPYPGNKLFDSCLERGIIPDKASYYANIDAHLINMTSMPELIWVQWINFLLLAERSWLWAKDTDATSVLREDSSDVVARERDAEIFRIEARCPHCGETVAYREMIGKEKADWPTFLGIGCTKCYRRIKVNIRMPVAEPVVAKEKALVMV